jgi:hypothetical protein
LTTEVVSQPNRQTALGVRTLAIDADAIAGIPLGLAAAGAANESAAIAVVNAEAIPIRVLFMFQWCAQRYDAAIARFRFDNDDAKFLAVRAASSIG